MKTSKTLPQQQVTTGWKGIFLAALLLIVALRGGEFSGYFLKNLALLNFMRFLGADASWPFCCNTAEALWYPEYIRNTDHARLKTAYNLLEKANQRISQDRRDVFHQAEALFFLGDHAGAAHFLSEHGWNLNEQVLIYESNLHLEFSPTLEGIEPSLLTMPGRYPYHIMRAYQAASQQHWDEAVREFRIGLGLSNGYATEDDWRSFYHVSAIWYSRQEGANAWLAGKYMQLAGEHEQAIDQLESVLFVNGSEDAANAWGWLYLGMAYEAMGDISTAVENYQRGWQISPVARENAIRLSALLPKLGRSEDAEPIKGELLALGPSYPLGRSADGYQERFPVTLPSGLTLVGYDVDPQTLSHSGQVTLWLWWQPAPGAGQIPQNEAWVDLGRYWLQQQTVINLVWNHNFEWGEQEDGLPLGWDYRTYSEDPASLYVTTAQRDGRPTRVVVAENNRNTSSGLKGKSFLVQPDGWYLMGGWMRTHQATNSNIIRVCSGPQFTAKGPYYAHWPSQPQEDLWVHIADLSPAFPGDYPQACHVRVMNYENPGGWAAWDDLFLFQIEVP